MGERTHAVVRPERAGDFARIAQVVEAAFGSPREARLVADIRASATYRPELSLVAEVADVVVGHVMISTAQLADAGEMRPVAMLSPLAVDPECQRAGIGSTLVRAATELADAAGEPVVVLQGDPRYYGRFGFEPALAVGISMELPDWAPPEAAQVLRLSGYDPTWRGYLTPGPWFDGLD